MQYLFGEYALDTSRCELRCAGKRIPLRPKVFDVLSYLIVYRDRVIAQHEFLEHLWPDQFVGESTLKSCIKEARRAVDDTGQAQRRIQTLHGRGYRFVATVEEAPSPRQRWGLLRPSRPHLPRQRWKTWDRPWPMRRCLGEQPTRVQRTATYTQLSWKASASKSPSCAVPWPMPGHSQRM